MLIAVDFDGTLVFADGAPNYELILALQKAKERGHPLILWTCREGEQLQEAVAWCHQFRLHFDAVNDNLLSVKKSYCDSRKIVADLYIDDRAENLRAGLDKLAKLPHIATIL